VQASGTELQKQLDVCELEDKAAKNTSSNSSIDGRGQFFQCRFKLCCILLVRARAVQWQLLRLRALRPPPPSPIGMGPADSGAMEVLPHMSPCRYHDDRLKYTHHLRTSKKHHHSSHATQPPMLKTPLPCGPFRSPRALQFNSPISGD